MSTGWFPVGDLQVARIVESEDPFQTPLEMFPDATAAALAPLLDELRPGAVCGETGRLIIPVQSYLIRTPWHTILVDACVGNHKSFDFFPPWQNMNSDTYMSNMRNLGVSPEDIDYVFCTHLHFDHSGWNTRLENGQWVPTFPNAKYVFNEQETAYCRKMADKGIDPTYTENVLPILEARRAEMVATDYRLDDHIWLESTPGHTPGHVAVHLASQTSRAVVTGDLIHSPIQCRRPEWNFRFDFDKDIAQATRRRFLQDCAESGRTVLGSHFPTPSVGRIRASGAAFLFEYLD